MCNEKSLEKIQLLILDGKRVFDDLWARLIESEWVYGRIERWLSNRLKLIKKQIELVWWTDTKDKIRWNEIIEIVTKI